ncbi:MAG: hypothetical protein J6W29_04530, partial [Neisseriaceae bacterium]|nr:hypothetical protein [Neisseriaceae bacterium]
MKIYRTGIIDKNQKVIEIKGCLKNLFRLPETFIVSASRAVSMAWQSPEIVFKRAASEFKN